MKRILLLVFLCSVSLWADAQALLGTTGLLHAPTADMQRDKTFLFGGNYLNTHPLSTHFRSSEVGYTFNYYINITIFPWLEVAYICTLVHADHGSTYFPEQSWGKFANQDRAFSARLRLWKEGWWKGTQLGYSTDNVWFYTLMGDLNTQFAKGYDYPDKEHQISNFFAPAYSNIALGMEWRPKSNYSLLLSPVSTKMTFVTDDYLSDLGAFGVDPGDHFKIEGGAFVKARAELPVMENVNLITTADFFTPYSKDFGNIDVNWDVLISMKINKVLSATINTTLKYDNDVKTFDDNGVKKGAKVQFKEVLGIGLAYNF